MTLFLFLKQFVDVLYQYHWLDYMMVILVVIMLIYQLLLVRPDIKKHFTVSDCIIVLLSILLTFSFLKDRGGYGIYFKVLSAFLMFFVGRVYYDRIQECLGALVTAGYCVVYLNFIYRLTQYGLASLQITNAGGDLYYYDTDMAFAMILAMVFIGMFGRNTLFKCITVFLVCPYMVLYSDAGIQKVLMWIVYLLMFIYLTEKITDKKKMGNCLLTVVVAGLLLVVGFLLLPVFGSFDGETILAPFSSSVFNSENMQGRYGIWKEIWDYIQSQNLFTKLFGIDLCSERLHNSVGAGAGSLYIKTLYSLGMSGMILMIVFVCSVIYYVVRVKDRKTFYTTVILTVMLLGTGVTVISMEATQMSWFPLMFAGMVISSVQVDDRDRLAENEEQAERERTV